MRGNDFMELRAFELVARRLSFSRAADEIGMSRATLSQIVKNLECKLGVRLLNRTTRSVTLTDAGGEFLELLSPALTELVYAVSNMDKFRDSPSGRIKILCSHLAADLFLRPILPGFSEKYPDITLEINIEDGQRNIVSSGFDAAVRPEDQVPPEMMRLKLGDAQRQILVASPKYIAREGRPQRAAQLSAHRCIGIGTQHSIDGYGWRLVSDGVDGEVEIAAPLVVNDHRFALESALAGMGIALLPESVVNQYLVIGEFEQILSGVYSELPAYYLCYPRQNFATLAFRTFIKTCTRSTGDVDAVAVA